jgi:hypothetical protein
MHGQIQSTFGLKILMVALVQLLLRSEAAMQILWQSLAGQEGLMVQHLYHELIEVQTTSVIGISLQRMNSGPFTAKGSEFLFAIPIGEMITGLRPMRILEGFTP